MRNIIDYFNKDKDDFIIAEWLFDERKLVILRQPFSESNEKLTKNVIKKLVKFTNNKCKLNIVWDNRNIRSFFQIKENVKHCSYVIYECNYSRGFLEKEEF